MDGVRMRIRLGRSQSAVGRAACLSVGIYGDAKPLSSLKGLLVVVRWPPDLRPGLSYGVAARLGRNAASRFAATVWSAGDVSRRTRGPSTAFGFRLTSLGMTIFRLISTQPRGVWSGSLGDAGTKACRPKGTRCCYVPDP